MKGDAGGAWDSKVHAELYGANLNEGLAGFIVEHLRPTAFLEFGCGLAAMANFIAVKLPLGPSYCIEPEVQASVDSARNLHLLNLDIFETFAPAVLDRRFDL